VNNDSRQKAVGWEANGSALARFFIAVLIGAGATLAWQSTARSN
jgi:hypothetical protein